MQLFKRDKKKSVDEVVKGLAGSLVDLHRDGSKCERAPGEVAKNLSELKLILYGPSEGGKAIASQAEDAVGLFGHDEFTPNSTTQNMVLKLLTDFSLLEFNSRQDVVAIFSFLLRQELNHELPMVKYLLSHSEVLTILMNGYSDPDKSVPFGTMLREALREPELVKNVLFNPKLFYPLFTYICSPQFDAASDAFQTFVLLIRSEDAVLFLDTQYEKFISYFQPLVAPPPPNANSRNPHPPQNPHQGHPPAPPSGPPASGGHPPGEAHPAPPRQPQLPPAGIPSSQSGGGDADPPIPQPNYATRRQCMTLLLQLLKDPAKANFSRRYQEDAEHFKAVMVALQDSSQQIQQSAFKLLVVFANTVPRPKATRHILGMNKERMLAFLSEFTPKGQDEAEDAELEADRQFLIQTLEGITLRKRSMAPDQALSPPTSPTSPLTSSQSGRLIPSQEPPGEGVQRTESAPQLPVAPIPVPPCLTKSSEVGVGAASAHGTDDTQMTPTIH